MISFDSFKLGEPLRSSIKRLGFTTPTQIQQESIPPLVQGKDVIGESATGSGKTLAFGCGVVERTVPNKGVQALILTPTRELAEQVKESLAQLSRLKVAAVYGGVGVNPQVKAMQRAEVVVATPGRLLDHLERQTIDVSKISMVVLDEADRMLDMGFIDDVERILRSCPNRKQTVFFSATISPRIVKLTRKYTRNPVNVSVANQVDPSKLEQVYYPVTKGKLPLLVHLMRGDELAMVFCNTRRSTDFVAKTLKANGVKAMAIHGGFEQNKRARTIEMFNKRKILVLVCTDVAARGIHIDDVSCVYNFDIPRDTTDYVHRIGRTARGGESGRVVNFASDRDRDFANVRRAYRSFTIKKMEVPKLDEIVEVSGGTGHQKPSHGRKGGFGGREKRGRREKSGKRGKRERSAEGDRKAGDRGGKRKGRKGNFKQKAFRKRR